MSWVRAFAPATVANVGCGFDVLGFAVEGLGDTVEARLAPPPGVRLVEVTGDGGGTAAGGALQHGRHRARIDPLPVPQELTCALVHPHVEVSTREARAVLPRSIPLSDAVEQWGNLAGLASDSLVSVVGGAGAHKCDS